ncbi:MAG: hypothetical protein HOL66_08090 [Rhodospirillaceae bacterium]|jgi:hypothetical protein|nr:hypothetical protein [Rhodospirillaceae bacterium]MBT5244191.1 hypothetical protein [Rhodospirillaceae bacterium]MBT5561716.1 hypothetical protein [Rhodospirillaceae bacterium]MBT6243155.1 hypothetical protein [Rhodospirillaceae bacterium]MBT7137452.1 hypothetical protein [Rhodospirillaceae bacterium]
MSVQNDEWDKEEYLAHLGEKQKNVIKEWKKKYRPKTKWGKIKMVGMIVLMAYLSTYLISRYIPDILHSADVSLPENVSSHEQTQEQLQSYINALVASAGEEPGKIYKWKSELKIHVLTELPYYDQMAFDGILKRISDNTPISITAATKNAANVLLISSDDLKLVTEKHLKVLRSLPGFASGPNFSQSFYAENNISKCGHRIQLDDEQKYIVSAVIYWDSTLKDDQTHKCIAGNFAGILGLRGMVKSGNTVRTPTLDPVYLTNIDIDILNRIYRSDVQSGLSVNASMDQLIR